MLNIPGAYASVRNGGRRAMGSITTSEAGHTPAVFTTPEPDAGNTVTPETGITVACASEGHPEVTSANAVPTPPVAGATVSSGEIPAHPAALPTADGGSLSNDVAAIVRPAPSSRSLSPYITLNSVVPAGDCGCKDNNKKSYVYSIGTVGFDFGTEADRDAFRQLMPSQGSGGRPPVRVPPNPYDVRQLVTYLDDHPYESTNLIWTLNLDLVPIYAIEAELAYAEDVYKVLREALRNQALPSGDDNYVSRVSIPGVLTSRTRRLFSGQVVPVVVAQPRGLYTWNEPALVDAIVNAVSDGQEGVNETDLRLTIRMLLDKVYFQFRNLGQTSPDRALNYAGTNAFQLAADISAGLLSAKVVPGAGDGVPTLYTIDTITVTKSPYCRIDSDCWDVQITFFNPENNRNARNVYLYTIDVSKEMPVSLAPTHQFLVAPSVALVSNVP
jgi:cyanobactin maturation PatA/PatG family protease